VRVAVAAIAVVVILLLQSLSAAPFSSLGESRGSPLTENSTPATSPAESPAAPTFAGSGTCIIQFLETCPGLADGGTSGFVHPDIFDNASWANLTPNPTPSSYPSSREDPSMTYDDELAATLLFGGDSWTTPVSSTYVLYQDTWKFAHGKWTELMAGTACTATSCPSPRTHAMLAYDQIDHEAVLFGGAASIGNPMKVLSDTWVYSNGAWSNVTKTAGTPPAARFDGSMTYDSADGYVLLFGGANGTLTTLGDTWTFVHGKWSNISASEPAAPDRRAGAAIADMPGGYVELFGGETNGTVIAGGQVCTGGWSWEVAPFLQFYFHLGKWTPVPGPLDCVASPQRPPPAIAPSDPNTPCGRTDAALAWSPKNNRLVLFGGLGYGAGGLEYCSGAEILQNDTWVFEPDASFYSFPGPAWVPDESPGAPAPRYGMGYSSDLASGFFLIFGGFTTWPPTLKTTTDETWRYYQPLTAMISGPTNATELSPSFYGIQAYGGSGNLSYEVTATGLRNGHTFLGCSLFITPTELPIPQDGNVVYTCAPAKLSYNIYRLELKVTDNVNLSSVYLTQTTVTVSPVLALNIYSEYQYYFYENFDLNNTFGVQAVADGGAATNVSGVFDGSPVYFSATNSSGLWWNSTPIEMSSIPPGSSLRVTGQFSGWTANATYQVQIINTPEWLQTIFAVTNATHQTSSSGKGPYGLTFTLARTYSWNLTSVFNFSLPVNLLAGNYSLIPTLNMRFTANSYGNITLGGGFVLSTPAISIGDFSLTLSAGVNVTGTFALDHQGSDITGITWESATITLFVSADVSGSIPIYGFEFDFLGQSVKVGFTLDLDVAPYVGLTLILEEATVVSGDVVSGLGVELSQLLGAFDLSLTATVSFGIGIASVALGGTVSIALVFSILPPPFNISGGAVNGSLIWKASFLCWNWNGSILGPGTIYAWGVLSGLRPAEHGAESATSAGSGWTFIPRYYNTTGYSAPTWEPSQIQGMAISDVYPFADVAAAAGSDGAYLFLTNDSVNLPVDEGLSISADRLDASTNALVPVPPPVPPGTVIFHPKAVTLPDGAIYVIWSAVPAAELPLTTPSALQSVVVQGALFTPGSDTWGPVQTWSSWGIAQSYQLAVSGNGTRIAVLVADAATPNATTPEQLLEFDTSTGTELSNVSVVGYTELVSFSAANGWVVADDLAGNFTVLNVASGSAVPLSPVVPAGFVLQSAAFAAGSSSVLDLWYVGRTSDRILLYDLGAGQTIVSITTPGNTSGTNAVFAGGVYYLFASTPATVQGWTVVGGTAAPYVLVRQAGLRHFGVVQLGPALLLYGLAASGNASEPIVNLVLAEVPGSLPVIPTPPSQGSSTPPSSGPSSSQTLFYLALAAVGAAIVLAVVAVVTRRRPPSSAQPPSSEEKPNPPEPEG
jgi:hypothetical protein